MRSPTLADGIAAGGVVLLGSVAVDAVAGHPTASPLHRAIQGSMIGGAGVGLLYAGRWHAGRSLLDERAPRILGWTGATALLFVAVGVVSLYIGSERVLPGELFDVLSLTASVGLATGVYVGTSHARTVNTAEAAARVSARAEALEAEQERAERLNDLLRHYVLNGVNVISGHVTELRPTVPDREHASLDAVDRRARSIATLVEHVDSLLAAEDPATPSSTVDLTSLVDAAGRSVGTEAAVSVRTPEDSLPVRTSGTLDDALSLLFAGVAAVTDREGEITIRCEAEGSAPTVAVTAAPVTVPEPIVDSPFEPITEVGLNFYLARRLLGDCGDLRVVDCAADELRFELAVDDGG